MQQYLGLCSLTQEARSPFVLKHTSNRETLSGVTQLKIGDICLFILYVWTCIHHRILVFAWWPTPPPYSTKQNPSVYQSLPVSSIVYPLELGCV